MKQNPLRERTYAFALQVVSFCRILQANHEYVLSRQLLKSGTGIGANVEESQQGQSRKDFIAKLSISLKEAHESDYWLRLIQDTGYDSTQQVPALRILLDEIISLLTAIIKTSKENEAKRP